MLFLPFSFIKTELPEKLQYYLKIKEKCQLIPLVKNIQENIFLGELTNFGDMLLIFAILISSSQHILNTFVCHYDGMVIVEKAHT